ncbi:HAD family hydrolase [Clostridium paridis]|uniref:HAD family hydrolase n=1 Tax=Clostridium paridis TaxID=2803863 RepID=A0A937FBU8_9CLOT|nr:HAD hydrolase-like protein [Clostridium paridis]MBL4931205.1 HAD family hydrolase [Clostridium paridis]
MIYRCLVLDHDDTVSKSTPEIHHPSFVEAMKLLRPDIEPLTLEEFVSCCFSPGFSHLCKDVLEFSEEEQQKQNEIWRSYTKSIVPEFYSGFPELIKRYKELGGIICVVSHSESEQILRDYIVNCNVTPDLIFGWDVEDDKRKPSPYPLLKIMKTFNLEEHEILVLDDLKPGLDMARACNIEFAAAGWSHIIPEIKEYMKNESDYYFETVETFSKFIFSKQLNPSP